MIKINKKTKFSPLIAIALIIIAFTAIYYYQKQEKKWESFSVCVAPGQCKTVFGAPKDAILQNVIGYPRDYHSKNSIKHIDSDTDYKKGRFDEKTFYFQYENSVYYFINAKIFTGFSEDAGKLTDSDAKTFQLIDANFSKDKYQVYGRENLDTNIAYKIILDADPKTFETLDFPYAKDKRNVYYLNKKIEGADVDTFKIMDNKICGQDKNGYYKDGSLTKEENCK